MNKLVKTIVLCILTSLLLIPVVILTNQPVNAASSPVNVLNTKQGPCNNPDATNTPVICGDNSTTGTNPVFGPSGIVTVIVKILSLVVGFVAIIFIIVQAIKMAASGGDAQAVASARGGLIYALVGLAVAAIAETLVEFVLNRIT